MTTRAARIWNGTAWEDLAAPVGVAPVSYQSTQPSSPQTGDIWIDSSTNTASSGIPVNYQATAPVNPSIGTIWIESDIDVPSVGQNLSYRWRRIASGGETSLSGNDSFGLPLTYTPGYEQFFLNGMLLYRDSDYTATTGTTITGFPALTAGDVIEVLAIKAEPLADTYTQAQSDSRFVNRNVGGLTLVTPTAVTNGTLNPNGTVTIGNAVSSVSISNAFSSTYDAYKIIVTGGSGSTAVALSAQLGNNGTFSNGDYAYYLQYLNYGGSTGTAGGTGNSNFANSGYMTTDYLDASYDIINPFLPKMTILKNATWNWAGGTGFFVGQHKQSTSFADFRLLTGSGTMTGGTIRIYGYNNGAA